MNGDDCFRGHDQQHHNDQQPLVPEGKGDLCQGISGKAVYHNSQENQHCGVKQCVCHIAYKIRVGEYRKIIVKKGSVRHGRYERRNGVHICGNGRIRLKGVCQHPEYRKQEEDGQYQQDGNQYPVNSFLLFC